MRSGDKAKKQSDSVPTCATPISITDSQHKDSDAFALYKILAGPHVPLGTQASTLELYFDDGIMERILRCTYACAVKEKDQKRKA